MEKETITLTKGELEHVLACGMGYAWNEANRHEKCLDYPMESYENVQEERLRLVNKFFKLNQNKDE